jgi:radical SAM superfamily enzyme YgiQ (UPF0313 family)
MKIVFLNPTFRFKISRASRWPEYTKSGTLYYPFWLAPAAALAEKKGHDVLLLDAIPNEWNEDETITRVLNFEPRLVVIDTSLPSIKSDASFSSKLKAVANEKSIDLKICLVGTFPSVRPDYVMGLNESIDFIARKEYDMTIVELANALEKEQSVEGVLGISYRKDGKIIHNKDRPYIDDLDEIPFASEIYKRFLDPKHYRYALARHPMIQIMSARGCPSMCVFCNVPQTFMSRHFRTRSAKNFVDELEWIKKNMPEIKEIFIEDDTMTVNKERILEICRMIKERKLNIIWSANARVDIPKDVLKEMKEAGCRMLIVGYESGNQDILNNIKKGITIEMAERFTRDAKDVGIKVFGCFMIGLSGDTKETIRQTVEWAKKLDLDMAQIEQAVPFPGTEFYDWVKTNNYLKTDDPDDWLDKSGQLGFLIDYPNLSAEELKKMRDKLMVEFYTTPKQMFRMFINNLHPHEFARLTRATIDYLAYLLRKKSSDF